MTKTNNFCNKIKSNINPTILQIENNVYLILSVNDRHYRGMIVEVTASDYISHFPSRDFWFHFFKFSFGIWCGAVFQWS